MLSSTGVGDHAVEAALLLDDGLEGGGHALLVCHIGVLEVEAAGEALEEGLEGLAGLGDVEAEDAGGVVGEADLGDAQTDALVGAGDWEVLEWTVIGDGLVGYSLAMTLSLRVTAQLWSGPGSVLRVVGASTAPLPLEWPLLSPEATIVMDVNMRFGGRERKEASGCKSMQRSGTQRRVMDEKGQCQ